MSPHDFLDEDRSYNWYMAGRFIFAGQGMSDKQRNKTLHKLVDAKVIEPRADKSGWQFTGEDLMAFIEKRNKRLEEVRQQKVDALTRKIDKLLEGQDQSKKNDAEFKRAMLAELVLLRKTLEKTVEKPVKEGEGWRK